MSYIGNILHHYNSINNRTVWFILEEPDDWSDTNLTMNTLIRHGNFDYISENTFWEPDITNHNIPNSYYLTEKPDFFTDTPWPVIGPDLPYSGIIPAQQRFCDLNGITSPESPSNLSAEITDNTVHLIWNDNSDDELNFRIEQSTDGTNFYRIESVLEDSIAYTIINLSPYSDYYFRVCAFSDISGQSTYSNVVMATTQDEIPDELVALYKFEGDASDSSGNGYHGVAQGATLTEVKLGTAYFFDGEDDVITVPTWSDSSLHGNDQAFTLAAWVNPFTVSVDNWVINDDSEWANFNFGLVADRLSIKWVTSDNTRYSLASVEYPEVQANVFSHIAATYDPTNRVVRMYLNGEQVVVDRVKGATGPWLFNQLLIGRGSDDGEMKSFHGIIDDVRIYKSCLSGDDINNLYNDDTSHYIDTPISYLLFPNYPNPFNTTTTIRYQLPITGHVSICVYDILGRQITTLVNEVKQAGEQTARWDGTDKESKRVSSGTYFYQIRWENGEASAKKMIMLK